jgi:chemotaxis protein methyltransferase CheR
MDQLVQDIADLTPADYEAVRKLVYDQCGINLGPSKSQLVRARLGKIVRRGGFPSYSAYLEHVRADASGEALSGLLDAISTNTTHLFRESKHFDFLAAQLNTWLADRAWRRARNLIRIWSAACSSGEEPYSIAMVAREVLRDVAGLDVRILATDISTRVLRKAQLGIFDESRADAVPANLRQRYLRRVTHEGPPALQAAEEIRDLIRFARFNLMSPTYPFRHAFDIIFCRNVMIYFDRPTQETLVNKFWRHLHEGGFLLIGHSESLSNLQHPYTYVEPTVYRR